MLPRNSWKLVLAAICGLLAVPPAQVFAAQARPDLTGLWVQRDRDRTGGPLPPLTAEGQRAFERNKTGINNSDPEVDTILKCWPAGFPRLVMGGNPFFIAQTPKVVVWVGGSGGRPQMIYIDDKHQDLWPRFMGDSVGHWEGDTLVVEVTQLTPKTFLHDNGLPHSTSLRVVERLRLIEGGKTLQNQVTMEDPVMLAKPWVLTFVYERTTDKPAEDVCENPRLHP